MKKGLILLIILLNTVMACGQDSLLMLELQQLDYFKLRDELKRSAPLLTNETRLYYTAILDNAFNKNELAIKRADSFKKIKSSRWDASQAIRLNEMLLDSYFKTYRYKEAAATTQVLKRQYTGGALDAIQNMQDICYGLINVPPQRVSMADATSVAIERNEMNLWEIPVHFADTEEKFLFDTGANISTISTSYAQKLGLKRIPTPIKVNGGQGRRVDAELGVADSLKIGNMTFYNVVFLVMPDEVLDFSKINFKINGIIGFPVINAMREIHISKKGTLKVPLSPNNYDAIPNMALNGFTPLVRTFTENDTLIFQFDSGAANTNLYSNYLAKHTEEVLANGSKKRVGVGSVGGNRNVKAYQLNELNLNIGGSKVSLKNILVYRQDILTKANNIAVGNLGQDVINQFNELVMNFDNMSIQLKN